MNDELRIMSILESINSSILPFFPTVPYTLFIIEACISLRLRTPQNKCIHDCFILFDYYFFVSNPITFCCSCTWNLCSTCRNQCSRPRNTGSSPRNKIFPYAKTQKTFVLRKNMQSKKGLLNGKNQAITVISLLDISRILNIKVVHRQCDIVVHHSWFVYDY